MKSNELRIGNWVLGTYERELDRGNGIIEGVEATEEVQVIALDNVNLTEYDIWVNGRGYSIIDGIPLTEEWLIRFGFEFTKCGISGADMWQGMDWWTLETPTEIIHLRGGKRNLKAGRGLSFYPHLNSEIKYVHQLQNLFFALTGEELKQ